VILISRYAGDVHLDTDAVLLGELAFAPFNRLILLGRDWPWPVPDGRHPAAEPGVHSPNYKELKLYVRCRLAAALGFAGSDPLRSDDLVWVTVVETLISSALVVA
jgi:hypothetical protein